MIVAEAGALLVVRRVDERVRDALVLLEPASTAELGVEDVLAKQDVGMYALRDL